MAAADNSNLMSVGALSVSGLRELGNESVFTISTAKSGNGVEQLRDGNLDTFWQSDGPAPHLINIQFTKKVSISKVCLYMDYTVDESYTAKKISVKSGTTQHDLVDITSVELQDPIGWCQINLQGEEEGQPLRTHMLQVRVLSMHQNGRDTHIRQVAVYGPRTDSSDQFKTIDMQQFSVIR